MGFATSLLLALTCVAGGVTPTKTVQGVGVRGDPNTITDGNRASEGAFWVSPGSVVLNDTHAYLQIDLAQEQLIAALYLQADNDDSYLIESSLDGVNFSTLAHVQPSTDGPGLRSREVVLQLTARARYLRISGREGDGRYAVSELIAYCAIPQTWPARITPPIQLGWSAITEARMATVRLVLAVAGVLLLGWGAWLKRSGRTSKKRLRDSLLVFLGATSFMCFFNFGHFHFDRFIHIWEHYHYYVGGKYFPELGYTRIYQCTAVAEVELGFGKQVADRKMRDLTTNHLETTHDIVENPRSCTDHFTPERWIAFKSDIRFFRSQFPPNFWKESQQDHGYNGTPAWGIAGRLLASLGPATERQLFLLAALDPFLLVLMWLAIWWAFGWRAMCVALIFWGTNHPARYYWNGGAYLRMDWLAFSAFGVCLLKRDRPVAAGFALTTSALLRIFPGFICIALVVKILAEQIQEKRWRLSPSHQRLAVGAALALITLIPLSSVVANGFTAWPAFVENSKKHLGTPLTNNVGLRMALAYEPSTRAIVARDLKAADPFQTWKTARLTAEHRTRFQFYGLVVAFLIFYATRTRGQPDWVAAALGVGLIPVAAELTCYYDSIFLLFALLWARTELAGIVTLAFGAVTCILARILWWEDDLGLGVTLATLVTVLVLTWLVGKTPKTDVTN